MGSKPGYDGSIPACAGEPRPGNRQRKRRRVDPRMRGGARGGQIVVYEALGRSPHARGSPTQALRKWPADGSIPACAGEPCGRSTSSASMGVDPRMRGGASQYQLERQPATGRSPHARGSRIYSSLTCRVSGSIPACAGEPEPRADRAHEPRVDPRMRGGATLAINRSFRQEGRSPHARGSRVSARGSDGQQGSIPACAGEPL